MKSWMTCNLKFKYCRLSTTNDYHRKENSMQITVIRKSDNSVITRIFEDEEGIKEITDDDYEVLIEKDSN